MRLRNILSSFRGGCWRSSRVESKWIWNSVAVHFAQLTYTIVNWFGRRMLGRYTKASLNPRLLPTEHETWIEWLVDGSSTIPRRFPSPPSNRVSFSPIHVDIEWSLWNVLFIWILDFQGGNLFFFEYLEIWMILKFAGKLEIFVDNIKNK